MKPGLARALPWLLTALAAAPFVAAPWLFAYWPGQDDANHLAIVHLLQRLADPGARAHDYLRATLSLQPYMLQYQLLLALGHVVALATAHRLLLTALIAGGPLALWALVRRAAPARAANVLLALPALTTGWPLVKGFLGFVLGVELTVALLATSWRWGDPEAPAPRPGALAAGALLLALATLAHPLSPLLLALAWAARWQPQWRRARPWLALAALLLPSLALVARGQLGAPAASAAIPPLCEPTLESLVSCPRPTLYLDYGSGLLPRIWETLLQQATYDRAELLPRLLALALVAAAIGHAAAGRRRRAAAAAPAPLTADDAALLRVAGALLLAFALLPHGLPGRGIVFIPQRALYLALFPLFAAAPLRGRWLLPLGLALALATAWTQARGAARAEARVAAIVAAGAALTPGATVLPLGFAPVLDGASVRPMRHAWGWLVLAHDVVTPYLFASSSAAPARFSSDRPLAYQRPFGPDFLPFVDENAPPWAAARGDFGALLQAARGYDYVLADGPPPAFLTQLAAQATLVGHAGDAWLYRRRARDSR